MSLFSIQVLLVVIIASNFVSISGENSVCDEADFQREAALLYEGTPALDSESAESVEECALHCANHPRCQSASWDRVGERCLLYSEVVENIPKFGLSDLGDLLLPLSGRRLQRSNDDENEERKRNPSDSSQAKPFKALLLAAASKWIQGQALPLTSQSQVSPEIGVISEIFPFLNAFQEPQTDTGVANAPSQRYPQVTDSNANTPPPTPTRSACEGGARYEVNYGQIKKDALLGYFDRTNSESVCANKCYQEMLCTSANFFKNNGRCELVSAYLNSETLESGRSSNGLPATLFSQPSQQSESEHEGLITKVTCPTAAQDERFFSFLVPFFNWLFGNDSGFGGFSQAPVRPPTFFPRPSWPRPPRPYDFGSPNPNFEPPPIFYPRIPPKAGGGPVFNGRRPGNQQQPPPLEPSPRLPPPLSTIDEPQWNCGMSSTTPRVAEFSRASVEIGSVRIIGGTEARPHSWPWQVSLLYYGSHICGGSLIDPLHVLTAAHCVNNNKDGKWYKVALGVHTKSDGFENGRVEIQVANIVVHEGFNKPKKHDNDVAVLTLVQPAPLSPYINTICLAQQDVEPGTQCIVTGWGSTLGTADGSRLQQVVVPIIEPTVCNDHRHYAGQLTETMMCAGYEQGGKDSCQGDSGGPLVCPVGDGVWQQMGIVSWGYGCARITKPGVYARITALRHWILRQTASAQLPLLPVGQESQVHSRANVSLPQTEAEEQLTRPYSEYMTTTMRNVGSAEYGAWGESHGSGREPDYYG